MKTLKEVKPNEMTPCYNAVLNLQNVVLKSRDREVKRHQVSTIGGSGLEDIYETKVVFLSEIMEAIVDGEVYDLMQQELPQSVRTPRRAVRITIETL